MKMKKMLSLLFLAWMLSGCGSDSSHLQTLQVSDGSTQKLIEKFGVEIADTPEERSLGLMYRQSMPKDEGMLFIYQYNVLAPFWMKNTLIPLDMIFIDVGKKVVSIIHNAEPQTETPRMPDAPYRYVLEINGGLSAELGIEVGDSVEF